MVKLYSAVAWLVGFNSTLSGYVRFTQKHGEQVKIHFVMDGLEEGPHGVHVHTWGDLTDGCMSTGAHYNPHNVTHGGPDAHIRHQGDYGNIWADANGHVDHWQEDRVSKLYGPESIIGRAIVVHAGEDDLGLGNSPDSLTTGNSGARLGCGVIGPGL
ncbi:superoxide dismutase [Dichotomocladium elegans]|nr:superoxide dismutase [Dichotomocladium elegans]